MARARSWICPTSFYDSKGQPLDVKGPREQYEHYFSNDTVLAHAMETALAAAMP